MILYFSVNKYQALFPRSGHHLKVVLARPNISIKFRMWDWTSRMHGYHSLFVFARSRVRVLIWSPRSLLGQMRDIFSPSASLHFFSNSSFTSYYIIRSYVFWAVNASLNNAKINRNFGRRVIICIWNCLKLNLYL